MIDTHISLFFFFFFYRGRIDMIGICDRYKSNVRLEYHCLIVVGFHFSLYALPHHLLLHMVVKTHKMTYNAHFLMLPHSGVLTAQIGKKQFHGFYHMCGRWNHRLGLSSPNSVLLYLYLGLACWKYFMRMHKIFIGKKKV